MALYRLSLEDFLQQKGPVRDKSLTGPEPKHGKGFLVHITFI